jgi:hypothetical protein
MILLSQHGWPAATIAELLGCDSRTVRRWVQRYNTHGAHSFADRPRPGRPRLGSPRLGRGLNRPGIPGGSGMPLVVWCREAGLPHATVVGWRVSNSIGLSMPRELWRRWRLWKISR